MQVKVSWSGGKDSTAATILHIQKGDICKLVHYTPMFTKEIPLITKRHHEFILNACDRFQKMGCEYFDAKGITYFDFVTKKITRGPRIGNINGFPCTIAGKCGFARDSKIKALNNIDVGFFDYEDIGIAFDEVHRHNQIKGNKRSILLEMQLTEMDAFDICIKHDMLSPLYRTGTRDGCALCYNGKKQERSQWLNDYPQARQYLIELQNIVKQNCPERTPLRNYEWFIDDYQLTIFD